MSAIELDPKTNTAPRVTALLVSPFDSDHTAMAEVFAQNNWKLYSAFDCKQAVELLNQEWIPVVACERRLRDGTWKDLMEAGLQMVRPPKLIVASRSSDEELSVEVRNHGGHSVMNTPFDSRELFARISMACHSWFCEYQATPA
ncbi:MAG TPA: hypothetical protein VM120_18045 [Bryobacteraceae bacterium]|nr:hypothetical protein [Bryobacteraceae bacterium]